MDWARAISSSSQMSDGAEKKNQDVHQKLMRGVIIWYLGEN